MKKIAPLHPGEVLFEEFMIPLGISQNKLGKELCVSPRRINEIVHGKRRITADTALRLSIFFGSSPDFWLGLQIDFDLDSEIDLKWDQIAKQVHRFQTIQVTG
ncbi:MAG: HigA family addiction module antidote protein [Candidatus Sabulitectum sp.]|nr:HigA family addiction module antidote protein [Candidatus Sabulitectum sp.]